MLTAEYAQMAELALPVSDLELRIRSVNALRADNVKYVGDLVRMSETELLKIPGIGRTGLSEIKEVLVSRGLTLNNPV